MKIIAYMPLHYGREYLGYAIRSVIDAIDELHILYAAQGSHGSRTPLPCPETRDELHAIATRAAGNKLRWHEGDWYDEGSQRMTVHKVAPDADIILALDADEVWGDGLAWWIVDGFKNRWQGVTLARTYRLPMVHYWRSFYRAMPHDPALPVRVVLPKIASGEGELETFYNTVEPVVINHFGYAQTPAIVDYKWQIHGHKSEYRRDIDWFQDRYLANAQADCHPVSKDYWTPQAVNPLAYLPEFMQSHPYYGKEVIE